MKSYCFLQSIAFDIQHLTNVWTSDTAFVCTEKKFIIFHFQPKCTLLHPAVVEDDQHQKYCSFSERMVQYHTPFRAPLWLLMKKNSPSLQKAWAFNHQHPATYMKSEKLSKVKTGNFLHLSPQISSFMKSGKRVIYFEFRRQKATKPNGTALKQIYFR